MVLQIIVAAASLASSLASVFHVDAAKLEANSAEDLFYSRVINGVQREKDLVGCNLPKSMHLEALRRGSPTAGTTQTGPDDLIAFLEEMANPAERKVHSPFTWLHWGDGDFLSLTSPPEALATNPEGADYHSQCVKDGLTECLVGEHTNEGHKVIESLGAFFLCNMPGLQLGMANFMRSHANHKFHMYDDFYLPVGTEGSPVQSSWVNAAKEGKRPVVIVGPKHLSELHCMFHHVAYFEIPIPTKGCGDVDRLVPQLIEFSQKQYANETVVFAVAGAGIGKMVAYKAFKALHHKDIFIDTGASLDVFGGRSSRDYNTDVGKFCHESKGWMKHDVCESRCKDIRPETKCSECQSEIKKVAERPLPPASSPPGRLPKATYQHGRTSEIKKVAERPLPPASSPPGRLPKATYQHGRTFSQSR